MILKFLILLIVVVNLGLPLNNKLDIFFIIVTTCLLILINQKKLWQFYLDYKYMLFIILFISLINIFIPKFLFEELHQVFVNKNDIQKISEIIPENIIQNIRRDYNKNFDKNRFLKSHSWNEDIFNGDKTFINQNYAYSTDSFLQNNKFSRINSGINFSSRESLRIGQINTLNYNFLYDKHFRRELPYYILFETTDNLNGSSICFKGNLYLAFSDERKEIKDLKNLSFIKKNIEDCFTLSYEKKYLYIFGYSINSNDNLEIKISYNLYYSFLKIIKYLLTTIILVLLGLIIFNKQKIFDVYIYLISSVATILLTLIRDSSLFFGLRYFRGGADGLLHYGLGREIVENINNFNIISALEGGEKIFYFMPGLRYFSALNNIIFGETTYGYLIACSFIPFVLYKIFDKLINRKYSIILFSSFIFVPIFENMGFGYFNYIWQFARNHAESYGILFFLYGFYILLCFNKNKIQAKNIFILSMMLSLSVFLRPNFFPASFILFLCALILLVKQKYWTKVFLLNLGYLSIFICLVHNLYFGGKFVFLTDSAVNFRLSISGFFVAMFSIFQFNFIDPNIEILRSQMKIWNPIYNLHRIFIILFICYYTLFKKHNIIIYSLFISMFAQHGLLLLTRPGSRHAYLAWLITFILFAYLLSKTRFIKSLNKNKSLENIDS